MAVIQANWWSGSLHVWAVRSHVDSAVGTCQADEAMDHRSLRELLSELLSQVRADAVEDSYLNLRWPSLEPPPPTLHLANLHTGLGDRDSMIAAPDVLSPDALTESTGGHWRTARIATLACAPAPVSLALLRLGSRRFENFRIGPSFEYWSAATRFVLELLLRRRFVPAVHWEQDGRARGYWRLLLSDPMAAPRAKAFVEMMPAVCRAVVSSEPQKSASSLFESFLVEMVDGLVRGCLADDELGREFAVPLAESASDQARFLQSLTANSPFLEGDRETRRRIHHLVSGWLDRLNPPAPTRSYRVILSLHSPAPGADCGVDAATWRVSVHVQSTIDRRLIVDAETLHAGESAFPRLMRGPFEKARDQLREDLVRAAEHFEPLQPCTLDDGPFSAWVTVAQAAELLFVARPKLELAGFSLVAPRWCERKDDGLRFRMELSPAISASTSGGDATTLSSLVAFQWRVAFGDDELSEQEFRELAASKEPLVRVKGQWTRVESSRLAKALAFLERGSEAPATLLDALQSYYGATEDETGLPVVDLRATGWIDAFLSATDHNAHYAEVQQPALFQGQLRPYQGRGLAWFHFLSRHGLGGCLADDMGLGKTIQLIALWLHERQGDVNPGPTLLIVPMSLVGNWQREISRFAPTLRVMIHHGVERLTGRDFAEQVLHHDIVISTYGLSHRDFEHLEAVDWRRIALDEAQNIKNPASKQSNAVRRLRAQQRLALTGTPIENRLGELWSIIDFLNPGYLGSATEFRRRFVGPVEKDRDENAAKRLRNLIRPFVLRRLKSDPDILPDLPEKMEMKVYCNLTQEQAGLYEATLRDMMGQIESAGGIQRRGLILAALVRLKQICNHPAQLLRESENLRGRSGKCERLVEMLEEVAAEKDRALVFTQFQQMGRLLQKILEESLEMKIPFLHGGVSQRDRQSMIDRFQSGDDAAPAFILSLKAGGLGLNLTAANHVFHFDRWWNPAVEDQATDRVHRIGQTRSVQVHKFVCIGTLEERIDQLMDRKRNLADRIMGGGEEWLTELSTEALRELLSLSRDAVSED